jgi:hypothetical protein
MLALEREQLAAKRLTLKPEGRPAPGHCPRPHSRWPGSTTTTE